MDIQEPAPASSSNAAPSHAGVTRPSLRIPSILLATWFGAGYLPKAPGTWGSAAALPLAWLLFSLGGASALAVGIVLLFGIGVWAASAFITHSGQDDPPAVVIDEVAGQCLVLLAASPSILSFAVGFLLFRLFDVWKPWPVSWADRTISGGLGVMLDDMLAGLYGFLLLWGLGRLGVLGA